MSATETAAAPTITNAGNRPRTPRKLFVNLPVADLQRSITFFEGLGFTFSPQFTSAWATCMLVGADAYFMLTTPDKFAEIGGRPAADPRETTGAFYTVSVESRAEVDAIVRRAVASGGAHTSHEAAPEDHGFMYSWSFADPDGHLWGVFWMDPAAIPADA